METLILRGASSENARLILQLAKKLKFSIHRLSKEEAEDFGIIKSINDGLQSGLLAENEKDEFVRYLQSNES